MKKEPEIRVVMEASVIEEEKYFVMIQQEFSKCFVGAGKKEKGDDH